MRQIIDISGQRFGSLTAMRKVARPRNAKTKRSYWECVCDCGNTYIAYVSDLRRGETHHCGCARGNAAAQTFKEMTAAERQVYISAIGDEVTRRIFTLRYIDGLNWHQVAWRTGGNTADSVRMIHNRYLRRNPSTAVAEGR